jgi:metallophosphoesterase (TIGR00282 family)
VRILLCGDVVGRSGREAVLRHLPALRQQLSLDFVIVNGENAAHGFGITDKIAREFYESGVDVITTGNHVWDQREAIEYLAEDVPILRPINYPPGVPGSGCIEIEVGKHCLAVVNVQGRVFMRPLDDPFRAMDDLLPHLRDTSHILVDLHAEATGEKEALAFHLDGRVSAVVGTHTHVPTADARVLPKGTAYITDVGMVGPLDSVIGVQPGPVIQRYMTQMYHRHETARGPVAFNAVLIDINDVTGRATNISLLQDVVSP